MQRLIRIADLIGYSSRRPRGGDDEHLAVSNPLASPVDMTEQMQRLTRITDMFCGRLPRSVGGANEPATPSKPRTATEGAKNKATRRRGTAEMPERKIPEVMAG
jgi:hypothetical protein